MREQAREGTAWPVIAAISAAHLFNNMMLSALMVSYAGLRLGLELSFAQLGLIVLAYQVSASLPQPFVGWYNDRKALPYALLMGMGVALVGLLCLSQAGSLGAALVSVMLVGVGASVFHPESARVACMAAGHRQGLAQSLLQVGGSLGSGIGSLLGALTVVHHGQGSVAWFAVFALPGVLILTGVGRWSSRHGAAFREQMQLRAANQPGSDKIALALLVLAALMLSQFLYTAILSNYYTFYLTKKFSLPTDETQLCLLMYGIAFAFGTLLGGPMVDRIGPKRVIWFSILGALPFTLLLPHANLFWTAVLCVVIGLVLAPAFPAILVYAQQLLPGKVGTVSGLFFGLAAAIGAMGTTLAGHLADHSSIETVYQVCAFLPLLGLLTVFLPTIRQPRP